MGAQAGREIYFSFFMFTADLRPDDKAYTQVLIGHLGALAEMGYDGFDMHIAPAPGVEDHRPEVDSYRRLREAFAEAGFGDATFTTNVGTTRTFDPTSPYREQREQALAYLKSRVDITFELNGGDPSRGTIMSGPFLYPYGAFPTTDLGEALWSDALLDWMKPRYRSARHIFQELIPYAAEKGVKLAIEPVKSWETPPPNMVSEALDFLEDIEGAQCGVTVDSAQVVMESQGPSVFKTNIARAARQGRLHYVHVSAPDRGAVHDSWIPWELMLGEIEPVYQGPWLVEVFNAVPPFDSSMRMARRRFWRPGEDPPGPEGQSAYDIAQAGLEELRARLTAVGRN